MDILGYTGDLTTPEYPLFRVFDVMVCQEVGAVEGVSKVEVELTFEHSWTTNEMSNKAKDEVGHLPGMTGF